MGKPKHSFLTLWQRCTRSQAKGVAWGLFFMLLILAWVGLYMMAPTLDGGARFGALDRLYPWAGHGYFSWPRAMGMWALMTLAMMLPTFIPTWATYMDLSARARSPLSLRLIFGAGYLLVWLGFACLASALQQGLFRLNLIDAAGVALRPGFTLALLTLAGLYQFSELKQACVRSCQSPLSYFMSNWRDGPKGAAFMGVKHGLICLGCCWALMLLAFVGGTMNLVWMGIATLLMATEKLPKLGSYVGPALGYGLLGLALAFGLQLLINGA